MAEGMNRSMSYSEPRRATSSPPPADLSAMACGRLERGGDAAQCVLVCLPDMSAALDVVPPYNPLYGLLTCHHVLPTVPDGTWKLILGPTARDKYQLNRSKILKLLSCCGPNGFWQSEVHVPLRGNQAAGLCPARGDWTLAILQPAFVDEIKRGPHEFFFPLITPFTPEVLKTAVQTKRCRLLERKPDGTILQHFIDINPAISQPKDGRQQLENEVCSYREMSVLRYPMTFLSTVKAGCSGAPIFCQVSSSMAADSLGSLQLLGIHSSSPDLSAPQQSGDVEQCGVAAPYILDSAIEDGAFCSLPASLAFVLEAVRQNKCLPQSMKKLIKHLSKRQMSHVQRHNQSNHEGRKKQIASNFELVEFILGAFPENMRTMRYQTLKQEETSLLYMELLCAIFSCFEGYEASELGVAAIGKDGAVLPVVGHVEGVCRSLYTLMKSLKDSNTSEDGDVIRMGFRLWWSLFHFNIIGGPVDTVLNDSTSYSVVNEIRMRKLFENDASVQRMFGNISVAYQSKMRRDNANAIVRQLDEQKAELEEKRVKEVNLLRAELQKGAVELENVRMESERHAVARTELEEQLKKAEDTIALCQNEKAQADNNWNRELEREKMRVCELTNRLEVLNRCPTEGSPGSYRASENGHSSAVSSTLQKRRSEANVQVSSSSVPLLCQDFWSQDIYDVFQSRPALCSKVASYFEKVKGARDGSWEHLMEKLKIDLDKKELETLPVKNILLAILCQWKRGCQATVRLFCEVSEAMGNSQVTAHMKMAAQQCARSVGQGDEDSRAFGTTLTNGSEKMSWQTAKSQSPGDEGESYQDVRSQRSKAEGPRRRSGQVTPDCSCESEDFEDKTAVTRTSILQDKATSIAQYMNPTEISPHLFQKRLLTQSQLDHLHSLPETKAKNTYIIHKVGSLGRKAVSLFVECLRATAYEVPAHEDLANELEPLLQRFCH